MLVSKRSAAADFLATQESLSAVAPGSDAWKRMPDAVRMSTAIGADSASPLSAIARPRVQASALSNRASSSPECSSSSRASHASSVIVVDPSVP